MNFDLTDEQQMLQGAAREFLAARLKSDQGYCQPRSRNRMVAKAFHPKAKPAAARRLIQ